jgi:hypothetical protein
MNVAGQKISISAQSGDLIYLIHEIGIIYLNREIGIDL